MSPRRAVHHSLSEGSVCLDWGCFERPGWYQSDSDEYWYLCRHITSCKSFSGGRLCMGTALGEENEEGIKAAPSEE